ncbi:MAG: riboflavin synthase subunit alpha [Myxococcota bacterium]
MFTGIVQGTAEVQEIDDHDGLRSLRVGFPEGALGGLERGASISVSGVCLTAVAFDDASVRFDVIDETLDLTSLGALTVGSQVNYERAATVGKEIGGHLLSGHVIGVAVIVERTETDGNLALTLRAPAAAMPYILPKGYIGLDGISLTIGRVDLDAQTFTVHLIPETRQITTIGGKRVGDRINLEVDAMTQAVVATVERVLAARQL